MAETREQLPRDIALRRPIAREGESEVERVSKDLTWVLRRTLDIFGVPQDNGWVDIKDLARLVYFSNKLDFLVYAIEGPNDRIERRFGIAHGVTCVTHVKALPRKLVGANRRRI